jgi:hypothetical protein
MGHACTAAGEASIYSVWFYHKITNVVKVFRSVLPFFVKHGVKTT